MDANWNVIEGEGVWMEGEALEQLRRLAEHPACVRAVGMPDLHPGPGTPIGASVALRDVVWPALLGGDLGCGVRLMAVGKIKARGDTLERRMGNELEQELLDVPLETLMTQVWRHGPRGLVGLDGVPEALQAFAAEQLDSGAPTGPVPSATYAYQLGSIGGGNHFLEQLARIEQRVDATTADRLGLQRGGHVVLAHSGSRGLGQHLARRWGNVQLDNDAAVPWLADLQGAVNFARTNRLLLCWRMLRVIGCARPGKVTGTLDLTHNTLESLDVDAKPAWVHRKGTAPAAAGQATVVLGSRGSPSWVLLGTGNLGCLCSVAHGAGRKFDRARSIALIRHRHRRRTLGRTALGGRVMCDDRDALYAEHPDCYKAIEPVITALEQAGTATRVASTVPLLTVKR